jgi:hypothetical protein
MNSAIRDTSHVDKIGIYLERGDLSNLPYPRTDSILYEDLDCFIRHVRIDCQFQRNDDVLHMTNPIKITTQKVMNAKTRSFLEGRFEGGSRRYLIDGHQSH